MRGGRGREGERDELLRRAREEGGPALGRLLESHRRDLIAWARRRIGRRLRGKLDPCDLVQETFLQAHRNFADFRGENARQLRGWLRRILTASLAMQWRRYRAARRDTRRECELPREADAPRGSAERGLLAHQASPADQAARHEQDTLVRSALDRLPDDYRKVVHLHHLQGLSFPEVARRWRRSLDSVKKLAMRAVARLRRSCREEDRSSSPGGEGGSG